jgi:hypothetical protein
MARSSPAATHEAHLGASRPTDGRFANRRQVIRWRDQPARRPAAAELGVGSRRFQDGTTWSKKLVAIRSKGPMRHSDAPSECSTRPSLAVHEPATSGVARGQHRGRTPPRVPSASVRVSGGTGARRCAATCSHGTVAATRSAPELSGRQGREAGLVQIGGTMIDPERSTALLSGRTRIKAS